MGISYRLHYTGILELKDQETLNVGNSLNPLYRSFAVAVITLVLKENEQENRK